jgi:hypothetical protein
MRDFIASKELGEDGGNRGRVLGVIRRAISYDLLQGHGCVGAPPTRMIGELGIVVERD